MRLFAPHASPKELGVIASARRAATLSGQPIDGPAPPEGQGNDQACQPMPSRSGRAAPIGPEEPSADPWDPSDHKHIVLHQPAPSRRSAPSQNQRHLSCPYAERLKPSRSPSVSRKRHQEA